MVNTSGQAFINNAWLKKQHCPAEKPYMIILKRDDLPYLTIDSNEGEDNSNRYLETDIDPNSTDIDSLSRKYIKAIVGLHYPKDFRYVRIDIPYILSDMDIDKIKPIDYLLS